MGFGVHRHDGPGETYRGVRMAGFTCAACHTGQIDHEGRSIIIEGGPAMHDAVAFQRAMARAMILTAELPWKRGRFFREVLERDPDWPGGRLALEAAFDRAVARIKVAADAPDRGLSPVPEGHGRLDALQRIANQLLADDLGVPENAQPMDAPVSFPPVWDIWRFDWVQYNASVRQPMVRNVGEALGVRARTNFIDAAGAPVPPPERWDSSVRVRDIDAIERTLHTLNPPPWPEDVLGPIDRALARQGRALFERRCAGCHAVQVLRGGGNPPEWHVPVVPLTRIGTDPNAARGFAARTYDATRLGVAQPITGVEALTVVTGQVKNRAYDRLVPPPAQFKRVRGRERDPQFLTRLEVEFAEFECARGAQTPRRLGRSARVRGHAGKLDAVAHGLGRRALGTLRLAGQLPLKGGPLQCDVVAGLARQVHGRGGQHRLIFHRRGDHRAGRVVIHRVEAVVGFLHAGELAG